MSKIIAITNQKGGVGKTTTAINLSAALGESGEKILLIDFDPQGNSSSGLLPDSSAIKGTIYDILCDRLDISYCIIENAAPGVDIIPASVDLSGAEVELTQIDEGQSMLRKVVLELRNAYDYIFIDCPPSIGTLTVNALTAADSAIIPVQCEYYALEGLGQVLNTIELVRQSLNPSLITEGILFTMYDARTKLSEQVIESVRSALDEFIFDTVIPRNVRLAEAPSYGVPVLEYDTSSRGAESYRLLAAELLKRR